MMKKLLFTVGAIFALSSVLLASLTVESAIYPVVSLNFTVSANEKMCTSNYEGFWFIQNVGTRNVWVSPWTGVKADGSTGGTKLLPNQAYYFKPLGIGGPSNFAMGSKLYAIGESGSDNKLTGWVEQY